MKNKIIKILGLCSITFLVFSCQNLDRPDLDNYPKDANVPGGPLKFYVAFDGTSSNVLMNAVDSIKAKFPSDNPLAAIAGISGKAVQGEKYKYVKYTNANDFAQNAGSFTVSVWAKKGNMGTDHIFSMPAASGYHWSGGSMFLLTEGSVAEPIVKFFVKDASGEKWFEWVPWAPTGFVAGIYDGNWHHLAFVYNGSTSIMQLYVDGQPKTTSEWTGHGNVQLESSKITGLKIGAGPQEFSAAEVQNGASDWLKNSWTGGIDQFRMYTTALSAADVQNLYTKKK
ncbi:LamG domain-containing protein [Kaistella yonginensis]|uniref:LamG domain-containing protein n=1 Tax=Kaistella yonginensis TaxID=658267 RepID=UPI0025B44D34|nr:LamG domain-containing protein [Kaistella yonginensis]MDN3605782.1 LamG domain-containing protein [Kaistella yonginensis]